MIIHSLAFFDHEELWCSDQSCFMNGAMVANRPGVGCTTSDLGCTSCTPELAVWCNRLGRTPNYRDFRVNLLFCLWVNIETFP